MSDDRTVPPDAQPTELEFRVTNAKYPFVRSSEAASCRCILREMLPRSNGDFLEFFEVRDASPDGIETIATVGPVEERLVDRYTDNGVVVFHIENTTSCVAATLADQEAFVRDLWAEDGDGRVVAEVMPSQNPAAVVDAVQDEHPTVDLVAKRDRPADGPIFLRQHVQDVLAQRLTARQQEVLITAYEAGYFQRPRETTGAEVAAQLDISPSTFSQHLRAAQRKLLTALFEKDCPAGGHRIDVE